jgi:hypothetical protein
VLAVCSCTILPLFAGIWKSGAGLGPAVTFLFVGPAINVLAVSYTGAAIGMDVALARIVLSILFGIVIGLVMAAAFPESREPSALPLAAAAPARLRAPVAILLLLLLGVLLAGTLQVAWLANAHASFRLGPDPDGTVLATLGRAHLTIQGAMLVMLLATIGPVAYAGFEGVLDRTTRWTWIALVLAAITLLVATPQVKTGSDGVLVGITGRTVAEFALLVLIAATARWGLSSDELRAWLWETWRFVKQIFPMLVIGVFVAGVLKELLPGEWIERLAGQNTLAANAVAVAFGVFMYFPTLVEVPIARMFLELGMHRGPLLAYLLADPVLSVQSILVTNRLLGGRRTALYVGLVAVFSTIAGLVFGSIVSRQ